METPSLSPQQSRKRRFLLVLPAIILPFVTLLFWSMGGGKGTAVPADTRKGFNSKLPDAVLAKQGGFDKLSYYNQAATDSAKRLQDKKSDPYAQKTTDSLKQVSNVPVSTFGPAYPPGDPAAKEREIYQKLAQLQASTRQPEPPPAPVRETPPVETVKAPVSTPDPELQQMNGMLEKILEIQHPELTRQKADTGKRVVNQRFTAIPAVIEGKQKVSDGTVVRFRLLDTVTLSGQLIPKGQLIYGAGQLYNQRMAVQIKILHIGYQILPVDLTVFDMQDGLEGICVPEAQTGDAIRSGADNGVQGLQFMSLDQSMSTQLAGAGLNAAKGLFSKKVKQVKGKLHDGHRVLLRDNLKLKQVLYH